MHTLYGKQAPPAKKKLPRTPVGKRGLNISASLHIPTTVSAEPDGNPLVNVPIVVKPRDEAYCAPY